MSGKRFLKVKIKSLAAEARIIKNEERKLKTVKVEVPVKDRAGNVLRQKIVRKLAARKQLQFNSLREHRVGVVRAEARNSLIAYAFLRGRPYSVVAPKDSRLVDRTSVARMALKYGPSDLQNLPKTHEAVIAYEAKLLAWFDGKTDERA